MPDYSDQRRPPGWAQYPCISLSLLMKPDQVWFSGHYRQSETTYPRLSFWASVPAPPRTSLAEVGQWSLLRAGAAYCDGLWTLPNAWYSL